MTHEKACHSWRRVSCRRPCPLILPSSFPKAAPAADFDVGYSQTETETLTVHIDHGKAAVRSRLGFRSSWRRSRRCVRPSLLPHCSLAHSVNGYLFNLLVLQPILDEEHVPGISGLVELDAISDALNKETWDDLLNDEERTRLRVRGCTLIDYNAHYCVRLFCRAPRRSGDAV